MTLDTLSDYWHEYGPAAYVGGLLALFTKLLGLLAPLLMMVAGEGRLYISLGSAAFTLSSQSEVVSQDTAMLVFSGMIGLVVLAQIWKRLKKSNADS
jgi:hypothetical protein